MSIRTGVYGNHIFLPPAFTQGASHYDVAVGSLVEAEQQGHYWALCADATDALNPSAGWTEEVSDLLRDAPDPNAAFTMEPVIASAAAVTSSVRFLWGPVDVVRRAPVNIAQTVLTLDHATKGRIAVILAQGQQNHMRQYGIARKGTADKLWDGVQIVRKLIRQTEPFSYRGRVWRFDHGALALPPYGEHPPEVFVAGGAPETLELVGRYADGWVDCIPGLAGNDPEVFAGKVREIRRHAEMAGRDPTSIAVCVLACTIMSDDTDCLEELRDHPIVKWATIVGMPAPDVTALGYAHPYGGDWNYFKDAIPEWVSRDEYFDVTSRMPSEAVDKVSFFGTADDVRTRLEPWLAAGVTDLVLYNPAVVCGSRYLPGCVAAGDRLWSALGKSVTGQDAGPLRGW